jgi:sugar lactone lactonase YvrE
MPRALVLTIIALIATGALNTGQVSAHPAWGIVVDRNNQIYFSDLETIWKIDAAGKLSVFRAGVSGRHIHELTIDESGNLYGDELIYEPATGRYISALWKMTPEGNFSYTLAPSSNPPKGLSIWRATDGSTYSSSWKSNAEPVTLIFRRTPDGKVTALVGNPEVANQFRQVVLYSVGGMAFGGDGSLYMADGANIWKVKTDGTVTSLARNLAPENDADGSTKKSAASTTRLLGITTDAEGTVFVADNVNRRVLSVTPDGKVTTLMRVERPWSPSGVAFSNGNLYVLEYGFTPPRTSHGARVRKLSRDGKVTLLANSAGSDNPAAFESSSNENAGPVTATKQKNAYVLVGAIASILALGLLIWRVRRKNVDLSASR